jgi:penicillin-binding protein 1A
VVIDVGVVLAGVTAHLREPVASLKRIGHVVVAHVFAARRADLPGWLAAGKTGTSQDFRDAWFVCYTSHLIAGVWLGNDDNSPTRKATGGGLPVEIWSRFMKVAHQGVTPAAFPGLGDGWPAAAPSDTGVPAASAAVPPSPSAQGGRLDSWLLDKLFGRR